MKTRKIISSFCALLFCVIAMLSCVGSALEAYTTPSIPAESNTDDSLTDIQVPQDIPAHGIPDVTIRISTLYLDKFTCNIGKFVYLIPFENTTGSEYTSAKIPL